MTPKRLSPAQRRDAAVTAKITGQTLRFRGNLGVDAAKLFFSLPESDRRSVKWLDLSDVGGLYAVGFLPIVADYLSVEKTVKIRVDQNPGVERMLRIYGYNALLRDGNTSIAPSPMPQGLRHFIEDDAQTHAYVANAVDEFLRRAQKATREGAQSLEWALGEIVGNVFHHAESHMGCLAQFLVQPGNQTIFTVVDSGMGIRRSLEQEHKIVSDKHALELAVQKGITSKRFNAGQGLFGSAAIIEAAAGALFLWSGSAALQIDSAGRRTYVEMPHYQGTLIDWRMPTWTRLDLQQVLRIQNEPLTLLSDAYDAVPGEVKFPISSEAKSFVDRSVGKQLRNKLIALTRESIAKRCVVDFSGVRMISSSFADEFLAKYATLYGEEHYKKFVRLTNIGDELILGIINESIQQRLRRERSERTPLRITR